MTSPSFLFDRTVNIEVYQLPQLKPGVGWNLKFWEMPLVVRHHVVLNWCNINVYRDYVDMNCGGSSFVKIRWCKHFLPILLEVYWKRWWRRVHYFGSQLDVLSHEVLPGPNGGSYNEKTLGVFCKVPAALEAYAVVSQVSWLTCEFSDEDGFCSWRATDTAWVQSKMVKDDRMWRKLRRKRRFMYKTRAFVS